MKRLVAGIVAHVDAGKTTLSEALLYRTGEIRRLGRVDHGDAFLDTTTLERKRGITIFAHQARVDHGDLSLTLLDTPGHVDFAAETERVLRVLDYAILVVSATDGVQGHTETLWRMLERYRVPTFIFVNKMDAPGADRTAALANLRARLDEGCVAFDMVDGGDPAIRAEAMESLAMLDDDATAEYLEHDGALADSTIRRLVSTRLAHPVYFGSALRLDGVDTLLDGIERWTEERAWPSDRFGARVFKVSHDNKHNRLTWLRVTGGTLKAKAMVGGPSSEAGDWTDGKAGAVPRMPEKADQLRVYNGVKFEVVTEAHAGDVCAVAGPARTFPGEGMGFEPDGGEPMMQPVLTYTVLPAGAGEDAKGADATDEAAAEAEAVPAQPRFDDLTLHRVIAALRELEDEDPQLAVVWVERLQEVHVQLMGEVQLEVVGQLLHDRFGLEVSFGPGSILYRETIAAPVEGVGHFEPLRHYAEVHLLLEPGEPGSGMRFASAVSLDDLDGNWQRLVLTHLAEKDHLGVLVGAPLADMRITLIAGRGHDKHTEGGDFRQATYRAVRMGLMRARERGDCRLLEPWYRFRLEVPAEMMGRAMSDVQRMSGTFAQDGGDSGASDGMAVLEGVAPVSEMRGYAMELNAYTHGRGRFAASFGGYRPCHDADAVVAATGYDPEADLDNTPDSVFCAHGAGYPVKWNKVPDFMHLDWAWDGGEPA